jgi:hypothetical protein
MTTRASKIKLGGYYWNYTLFDSSSTTSLQKSQCCSVDPGSRRDPAYIIVASPENISNHTEFDCHKCLESALNVKKLILLTQDFLN